ncbi:hypothetical protein I307_01223 [Cryptococcus deuterogattii 99/473]|uniref:Uncharacterized protein n=1 Tax=Cryptococcus deuterogattii Ram5 TaxID=1296110 RepID=A0A0D0V665_9TREE|nr:hypothetical protein I309_01382 [Cryptococcus deuterogattii LA55]KIR36172.1 hypothetical protein I352_01118 [Cryptococcus deuterogattii MMRL2647]KIR42871.1 hypothetical protein I313_01076 [Cryptococcus deuterogattii Ram5]KIR75604.1 hypothetical protein I310_00299 [Cryptococcus deuterogattii CA1014]KIR95544.1 hypothetical protein I304_00297 [Cryptococcus deuterogattii CBS 10090]KIS02040.1 hypothetical protein L804_00298 [Cryptococcus deuterogattii 2001/935-1]KIY59552.1 hypothetical protein 
MARMTMVLRPLSSTMTPWTTSPRPSSFMLINLFVQLPFVTAISNLGRPQALRRTRQMRYRTRRLRRI